MSRVVFPVGGNSSLGPVRSFFFLPDPKDSADTRGGYT